MLVRAIVADQNQPMQINYSLSPKQGEPVLDGAMKVHYDPETDTLTMRPVSILSWKVTRPALQTIEYAYGSQ